MNYFILHILITHAVVSSTISERNQPALPPNTTKYRPLLANSGSAADKKKRPSSTSLDGIVATNGIDSRPMNGKATPLARPRKQRKVDAEPNSQQRQRASGQQQATQNANSEYFVV